MESAGKAKARSAPGRRNAARVASRRFWNRAAAWALTAHSARPVSRTRYSSPFWLVRATTAADAMIVSPAFVEPVLFRFNLQGMFQDLCRAERQLGGPARRAS